MPNGDEPQVLEGFPGNGLFGNGRGRGHLTFVLRGLRGVLTHGDGEVIRDDARARLTHDEAGMLLAVPLTMIVKISLENSAEYRWFAALLDPAPRMRMGGVGFGRPRF